jgi:hypothetical protein
MNVQKRTTCLLCGRAEKALQRIADEHGISRSAAIRRLLVYVIDADAPPKLYQMLSEGYGAGEDGRSDRSAVHTTGNPGRAPSLGHIADEHSQQGAGDGMEMPAQDGPEGGERRNEDQNGGKGSLLDRELF